VPIFPNPSPWKRNINQAQAVVEFALILPVTLLLLLGMIETGRAFVFGVSVQNGAREAARLAANERVNPGLTDSFFLQRLIDSSAPAMAGCTLPSTVTSTPVTFTCGGGTWTLTLAVTPNGSSTSVSSFSALTAAQKAQMNGGQVEVKAIGSVSLLAGLNTGSSPLSLYNIAVQGDAIMAVL
jgi:Flp pilus assembly protein TadG